MRTSDYDDRAGGAISALLSALAAEGKDVKTYTNGNVSIDSAIITSAEFDRIAMNWDGDADELDILFGNDR